MPSVISFVEPYHKVVCKQIEAAIIELREQGQEVYPPSQITYTYHTQYAITLPFIESKKEELNDG